MLHDLAFAIVQILRERIHFIFWPYALLNSSTLLKKLKKSQTSRSKESAFTFKHETKILEKSFY